MANVAVEATPAGYPDPYLWYTPEYGTGFQPVSARAEEAPGLARLSIPEYVGYATQEFPGYAATASTIYDADYAPSVPAAYGALDRKSASGSMLDGLVSLGFITPDGQNFSLRAGFVLAGTAAVVGALWWRSV